MVTFTTFILVVIGDMVGWSIVDVEIADLNEDDKPELLVYRVSDGKGNLLSLPELTLIQPSSSFLRGISLSAQ